MKKRIDWIDNAKAIGILFVILGHSLIPGFFKNYLYSFHIPLFFFITGLFVIGKKDEWKNFLFSKINRLIVPYFFFSFVSYIFWLFIRRYSESYSNIDVLLPIKSTLYDSSYTENAFCHNGLLWFLPCLFITCLIFYFINKIKNRTWKISGLIMCSALAYLISEFIPFRLPWGIDSALIAVPFVGIAALYRKNIINLVENKRYMYFLMPVLLLTGISFNVLNERIDFNHFQYGNSLIYLYISAFSGILFWLYMSRLIKINPVTSFIGRHTLIIFLSQAIIFDIINGVSGKILKYPLTTDYVKLMQINPDVNPVLVTMIYVLTPFIFSIPVIFFIKKYCPVVIGEPVKKS